MGNIYIGIIMLLRIVQHMFNKRSSSEIGGFTMFVKYGAYRQLFSAALGLLLIIIAGKGFRFNAVTIITATVSGLALFGNLMCSQTVLKSGTMALNALFGTAGMLVPCIAGIFLFDAPMSAGQLFGVGLLIVSSYFLISSSSKIHTKFTFKTFLLLMGTMLSNGITMLMQQMFAHYVPDGDVSVFSLFSFGIVGVALLLLSFPLNMRKTGESKPLSKKLLFYGAILSTAVFIINQLATISTVLVPPAVLFAFINGGSTIIAAVVAAVCFKEKLTFRSVCGVLMGVTALVVIKAI